MGSNSSAPPPPSVLFDHNADTIRTGTGWIGSDDGILVRDLNANGTIDTGGELFGIDTLKSDGSHAVNGFDALEPYLQAIELTIDENGIRFATTALTGLLDQRHAANEREALVDLVELNRYAMPLLDAVGFNSFHVLRRWMDELMTGAPTQHAPKELSSFAEAAKDRPGCCVPKQVRHALRIGTARASKSCNYGSSNRAH